MTQDMIVFIVLALVFGYIIYSGMRNILSAKSGKCSGCCGCSASEEIRMAVKQKKSN